MDTKLEIIFKGNSYHVDYNCIRSMFIGRENLTVSSPENTTIITYEDMLLVFKTNDYAEISFGTNYLEINDIIVKHVYVNIFKNYNQTDVLFFFDAKDMVLPSFKTAIDACKYWCETFKDMYSFDTFICQIDNGSEGEYYFDGNGLGPYYKNL